MKYLAPIYLVFMLCACGGNDNSSGKSEHSKQDSSGSDSPQAASSSANMDTLLWIGKPARWKISEGEIYGGSYDSTNGLFVKCGKKEPIKVPRENIEFDLVINCDTSLEASVKVMLFDRIDSTYRPLPHKLNVADKEWTVKPSVILNNGNETIHLKPRDAARVKEAAMYRNNIYVKKQTIIDSKK